MIDYDGESDRMSHLAVGAPRIVFPDDLGKVRRRFAIPFTVENFSGETILVELAGIRWENYDILQTENQVMVAAETQRNFRARVRLPESVVPGEQSLSITLEFADDLRVFPRKGSIKITLVGAGFNTERLLRVLAIIGIGIVAVAFLAGVILLLRNALARSVAAASASPIVRFRELDSKERAIEMIVEGQNRNIGTRNIHIIRDGGAKSIGAGSSAYLIFTFPVRHRIAEIVRTGDEYSFRPLKIDFCVPDVEISDCLDREILLRSAVGHIIRVRFRRYVSPLEQLNRIMHLTDHPGRRLPWD